MKRFNKIFTIVFTVFLFLLTTVSLSACDNKKYNVEIRIEVYSKTNGNPGKSLPLNSWIVSSNDNKRDIVLEYGKAYTFEIKAFRFVDIYELRGAWIECENNKIVAIESSLVSINQENREKETVDELIEKGKYLFCGKAYSAVSLLGNRSEIEIYNMEFELTINVI